jgi:serine/threonine protein kinase/Tol biopolymer transport system component
MAYAAGTSLGHYQLDSLIGEGGMGEVYRATDTRLQRTVAIKVLKADQNSVRPPLQERFEREARAISSLNHPHICALYEYGHENGIDFLVMEYVAGETLAQRLTRGPLPVDQALRHSIGIAGALDQAQVRGIIHRDLKPGNIILSPSGAKLLDFGLVKLRPPKDPTSEFSSTATNHPPLTSRGVVLGTLQYMSPEQLEGKEVDARTDIFSFGVVVYEMVTGRRAFQGDSPASLIAAILSSEPPPISAVQPLVPDSLDHLVKTCLAKQPEERWQSAHDLKSELEWIAKSDRISAVADSPTVRRPKIERLALAVASILFCLSLAALSVSYLRHSPSRENETRTIRFSLPPPGDSPGSGPTAISPDGQRLVIFGQDGVYIRPLRSLEAQLIPQCKPTSGTVFWSPDSRHLAFFASGGLKKIDVMGGFPQTVCERPKELWEGLGGTWGQNNTILFVPNEFDGIYRVLAAGGQAARLIEFDTSRQQYSHLWPYFLPDGNHFLYLGRSRKKEYSGIYVGSLDSKDSRFLFQADSEAVYAPPGYILYVSGQALVARPFDSKNLRITADSLPIAEHAYVTPFSADADFSVSENGVLAYKPYEISLQLTWFDRTGRKIETLGPSGDYSHLRLSPDDKQVAIERLDPLTHNGGIRTIELARGIENQITSDSSVWDYVPVWSPDGSQLVFTSNRDQWSPGPDASSGNLYMKALAGNGGTQVVLKSAGFKWTTDWSLDGRFVLYFVPSGMNISELWALPISGDRKPALFLQGASQAQFSPDGRWVAYAAVGQPPEIYVRPFPGGELKWKISTQGGTQPRWRRDGRELFYVTADQKLMVVDVQTATTFRAAAPRPLFKVPGLDTDPGRYHYDVTRDGQRFLIATGEPPRLPVTIVVNWAAELKR